MLDLSAWAFLALRGACLLLFPVIAVWAVRRGRMGALRWATWGTIALIVAVSLLSGMRRFGNVRAADESYWTVTWKILVFFLIEFGVTAVLVAGCARIPRLVRASAAVHYIAMIILAVGAWLGATVVAIWAGYGLMH